MLRNIKNICNKTLFATGKRTGILETVLFDRSDFHITFFSIFMIDGSHKRRLLVEASSGLPDVPEHFGRHSLGNYNSGTDCSVATLIGTSVYGRDGLVGTTATVVVDDTSWIIRYLIVDTEHAGKEGRLPVDTGKIDNVEVEEGRVHVDASLEDLYA